MAACVSCYRQHGLHWLDSAHTGCDGGRFDGSGLRAGRVDWHDPATSVVLPVSVSHSGGLYCLHSVGEDVVHPEVWMLVIK